MTRASAGILGAQVLWTDQRGTLVRNLAGAAGLLALAGAICCLPFSQAALLIGAAIGGVLLLLRPTLGLYVLAFAVPFGSLREISLGGLSFGASELLVLATSGALLLRQVAARQVQLVGTPCSRAIWLFVGTLLLSFLPARELTPAIKELAKWVELLLVYTVVASATSRGEVRVLAGALLVAGLCEGLLGAWQFFRQVGPPGFLLMGRYMRAYGTFDQPNPYGGYLGLLLPLAYGLVLSGWRRGSEAVGRRTDWLLWILALVSGGGMLAGLVMSWSRGALLGLAAGLVLVMLVLGRRAWAFALVCVLVLALLGPGALTVLPQDLVGRTTEVLDYVRQGDLTSVEVTDANFAVVERAAHWLAAWRMFSEQPWIGVGTGQYAVVYRSVSVPRWQDPLGHAHNYYLNILAEGGLVGLAAYLFAMGTALVTCWGAVRRATGWERGIAIGALGMVGHLLAHSVVDNLYVHEMYLVVGMVLGMVASLRRDDTPDPGSASAAPRIPWAL